MKTKVAGAVVTAKVSVGSVIRSDASVWWYGWICYVLTPPNGHVVHTFSRTSKGYQDPKRARAAAARIVKEKR